MKLDACLKAVIGLTTAILALITVPAMASGKPYLDEFKLYQATLAEGDRTGAAEHGRAAWQAAEAMLGDDQLTAILAYNYGALIAYTDPHNANTALMRADALSKASLTELPEEDLALYLAYTTLKRDENNRRTANKLHSQLKKIDAMNALPSPDLAISWFDLATAYTKQKRFRLAEDSAQRAEALIAAALPEDYRYRATAIILQGVSKMSQPPREEKLISAMDDFNRARFLFAPQDGLENFDPILAQSLAGC